MRTTATRGSRRFDTGRRWGGERVAGVVLGAILLVLGIGLSACDSGQEAATASEKPDVAGVNGTVGQVHLDDVFIASSGNVPAGAAVPLRGSFTNLAGSADRLVSVTTPAAASVVLLNANGTASPGGIVLPSQTQIDGVNGAPRMRLQGVLAPLSITRLVPVTFTFSTAGSITLEVPIAPGSGSSPSASPPPS